MANILIVDNESDQLEYYQFLFEEAGHNVSIADSVHAATHALNRSWPSAVIIDFHLPDGNAKELLQTLAAHSIPPKLIIHSAYSYKQECFPYQQADAFVFKSPDASHLLGAVSEVLARPRRVLECVATARKRAP